MDIKAGNYNQSAGYKAFMPEMINRSYHFDEPQLLPLIELANLKLGELKAYAELVPDIDHFIRLHVVKEATVSSRIEGTQTNMEEALLNEEEINPEKRNDWREVNNYIHAMNQSIELMEKLPLSSRLLKHAHRTLLHGVRGKHKLPGQFRTSQNWIGGATLKDAAFIPPMWQDVEPLMGDLENFIHNEGTGLPYVIKAAIAHYQFETIHPFLDGNGRIGRLMITLYFIQASLLTKPVLYLSDFFDRHRSLYYDNLMAVRTRNDYNTWMKFFVTGIIETSQASIEGLRNIIVLKQDCETRRIPSLGKKMAKAQLLLQHLFMNPVIRPVQVAELTKQSLVSSYKLIDDFVRLKILVEMTGNDRKRIFIFEEYFKVFNR